MSNSVARRYPQRPTRLLGREIDLEVGHRISRESVHSVTLVDLSSVRDPALVPPAVASAVVPQDPESPRLQERLLANLRERQKLIILDHLSRYS